MSPLWCTMPLPFSETVLLGARQARKANFANCSKLSRVTVAVDLLGSTKRGSTVRCLEVSDWEPSRWVVFFIAWVFARVGSMSARSPLLSAVDHSTSRHTWQTCSSNQCMVIDFRMNADRCESKMAGDQRPLSGGVWGVMRSIRLEGRLLIRSAPCSTKLTLIGGGSVK